MSLFAGFSDTLVRALQIIWIDLLLSGDNAVVIALACRNLPEDKRRIGAVLGAAVAVILRVVFTLLVVRLLELPAVRLCGGILLIIIAVNLLNEDHSEAKVKSRGTVWGAVMTITLADAVMSLDNVLAIAAASGGNGWLVVFGLAVSLPLVVFGAGIVLKAIDRFPLITWAGAALLGWVAGHMLAEDPIVAAGLDRIGDPPDIVTSIAGAIFVIVAGLLVKWRRALRG